MTSPRDDRSARFVQWLVRNRVWVLAFAAALALVGGWRTTLTYKALRSDLEELLPKSAPSVASLEIARDRLPGVRHLGVVVDTGGPHNVDAANRFLDDLAERVRAYPRDMVTAVRTDIKPERLFAETYVLQLMDPEDVADLRKAVEAKRDWEVTRAMGMDLLEEDEASPPKVPVAQLREKYEKRHGKAHAFPADRFVADDGMTVVMVVQASSQSTSFDADHALLSRVQGDVATLGSPDAYATGMRVGYAGDLATRVEEMEGLFTDLSLSGLLVALLSLGSIVWFFRSWRSLPIIGVPLLVGTVMTFAFAALPPFSIRHLNSNTAFLGSIVVGNGINTSIILLARFQEERWAGHGVLNGAITAVRETWRPTLAAAVAASMAYGSLVVTDFRGFNQFGWIGGIGMVTCWAATIMIAPPLMSLFGDGFASSTQKRATRLMSRQLANFALPRARWVLVGTALLTVLAGVGLLQRKSDWLETDFAKLRRRDSWESGERYWGKRMDATLRRYLTPTVIMASSAQDARVIEDRVRALQQHGNAGDLIASVRAVDQLLSPRRKESLQEARKLREVLSDKLKADLSPQDRALVERALSEDAMRPLEADMLPDVLAAGLRDNDGRLDRNVLVFPKLTDGTWDADRMAAFTADLREAATVDGRQAPVAGSLLLSSDIVAAMKADGPRATGVALGMVLLIAIVAFRAVGLSFAAVASLLAGVTLMLGAMAWGGQRLNFSNFVALPITFGIAADYSINMLKRYQADGKLDLQSAVASTGGAVAMCSATTIIGFGSLLVAQNQALFSFGVFATTGELTCLGTAIVALPAALLVWQRWRAGGVTTGHDVDDGGEMGRAPAGPEDASRHAPPCE
ncbi:MAG: MMPL family transporter [Polyangiaceae bacterium]|jgi:hypothetical protein|nr:MMPL family transporter [Polyangiaceae bacterium]